MTREEVLSLLGNTQDIGSGIYIYVYEVDGEYLLRIPFASDDAQLGVTGEDLLKALTPISEDIDSNETVEFNGQLFNKSDLTEETLEWLEWYNSLSPEEQLAVSSIPVLDFSLREHKRELGVLLFCRVISHSPFPLRLC